MREDYNEESENWKNNTNNGISNLANNLGISREDDEFSVQMFSSDYSNLLG